MHKYSTTQVKPFHGIRWIGHTSCDINWYTAWYLCCIRKCEQLSEALWKLCWSKCRLSHWCGRRNPFQQYYEVEVLKNLMCAMHRDLACISAAVARYQQEILVGMLFRKWIRPDCSPSLTPWVPTWWVLCNERTVYPFVSSCPSATYYSTLIGHSILAYR